MITEYVNDPWTKYVSSHQFTGYTAVVRRNRRGSRDGAPGARALPTQWACLEKSSLKLFIFARKHPRRMELINILDSDG